MDKIRNLARKPEGSRLVTDQLVHLYVSNIRARTCNDITDVLKREGIQIQQDGFMKFEIKYSKKLRLEAAALTVFVSNSPQLTDLLTGARTIEGILGPASFTIIENDSDKIHQAELTPSSQVDRRLLPRLAGIWTALGASEAQFLSWVLLCVSTFVGKT